MSNPNLPNPYDLDDVDVRQLKKGRIKPTTVIVGSVLAAGAVAVVAFAVRGESQRMSVEDTVKAKAAVALLPGAEAIVQWRDWAKRGDVPEMQREAFIQLAWAKDPQGLDLTIEGLKSPDVTVRGTAAQALFEYGAAAEKARPALLEALKGAGLGDKPQIVWALALLGEASALDEVLTEYRAGHLAGMLRVDGSPAFDPEVLAKLATLERLATMTSDESPSVRQLAATALSRSAEPKWTTALVALVQDKDIDVAREAAVGLGKIANEQAMGPLLEALSKADKDSRQAFLVALRDGVGGRGLVLALRSVQAPQAKHQTKVIFDMLRQIEDPRVGDALTEYLAATPDIKPHWRTEAALRMAEVGDLRAVPHLAWRMRQDPLSLYNQVEDPEYRQDDNERVVSARMLADLALLHPEAREQILRDAEGAVMEWITAKPQPHANGLRFLVAAGSKQVLPKLKAWANPGKPLPLAGAQPPLPLEWETAQSALRYLGWTKDPGSFALLERQLNRQTDKKIDMTMDGLMGSGMAMLGMVVRGLSVGSADGFAQWGDSRAYGPLVKFIEDKNANDQARRQACYAVAWTATDANMEEVAGKVARLGSSDPREAFVRTCYLESLGRRALPAAQASLLGLIEPNSALDVRRLAARALGMGGVTPATAESLLGKASDASIKTDAVLALMLGADSDTVKRAIAGYNEHAPEVIDDLKNAYNGAFAYWSDANYTNGDVARWVANAEAAGRVKVRDALQDWPRRLLSRSLEGEFDNGPRSMTRVQLRTRLYRDAKGSDAQKQSEALSILKFMKEKGVLMSLRSEPGPWQETAARAFYEVMNPKLYSEALPDAK